MSPSAPAQAFGKIHNHHFFYTSSISALPFKCWLQLHCLYLLKSVCSPLLLSPSNMLSVCWCGTGRNKGNVTPHCLPPRGDPVNIFPRCGRNCHHAVANDQTEMLTSHFCASPVKSQVCYVCNGHSIIWLYFVTFLSFLSCNTGITTSGSIGRSQEMMMILSNFYPPKRRPFILNYHWPIMSICSHLLTHVLCRKTETEKLY